MFGVTHLNGEGESDPPLATLLDLYDELSFATQEHGDVAVVNDDSGWCMSAHRDGRVILEHLKRGGERHMIKIPKNRVIEMWKWLIQGEMDLLLSEPWKLGYGEAK